MEEVTENLTQDDVLELIKDFPVTPLRNRVIITTNVDEIEEDEIDLSGNSFSPEQYVLAVGSYNKDILSPGQKVYLDLEAMTINVSDENILGPVKKIALKPVQVKDRIYGMITDDKIEYLINE